MYYADVNFYWYYIGREDQSVQEDIMVKRFSQQAYVNKLLIELYDGDKIESKKCKRYMRNYLQMILAVTSILAYISKDEENIRIRKELWQQLKDKDEKLYNRMKRAIISMGTSLPGKGGRKLTIWMYHITRKIFKFN